MRNNLIALFLSLLIHLILFLLLFLRFEAKLENVYNPPPMGSEQGERVSLKHFRFQQGTNAPQNMESKNTNDSKASLESLASMESKKQESKTQEIEKEISQQKPKVSIAQPNKTPQTKESKTLNTSKTSQNSKASKETKASQVSNSRALEKSLSSPSIYDFGVSEQTQQIQDLYGIEFGSLSPNAQRFIKSNLDKIGKITQRYLRYPAIAGKVGQEGDNIVEFYLHPNGDITDLKLLHSSGYTLLDDNSLHTIKIAYKDYPCPIETTKIRIRVMYRIY
ncbi:energy transducer TonB [Helicobacter winghamensis]|uniref:energy transducer TonB n=1 Tax=Helicobacter winghamensis TaxID=157268 RepID=UPI0018A4FAF9|nr:energy transducer TonB [Helicobacter winghamensis]QOQ97919.1 energy transducer TonB [Helicobacter winghamensis]